MLLVACCLLSVPLARQVGEYHKHIRPSEIFPCFHFFRGGSTHLIADRLAGGGKGNAHVDI